MSPPENALVMCVDEKSQILDRTAPCLPMLPTTPGPDDPDYVRNGTTSLFAAFDLASGSVIAQHYRRHRHQEFLRFLKLIDTAVPKDLDLHLVLDNYATHKTPEIHKWLLRHPGTLATTGTGHRLRWSAWRRRHQHRAKTSHYQRQARQSWTSRTPG
jgi:DDE superfamily endonuclease